jgi:hypothetical protein
MPSCLHTNIYLTDTGAANARQASSITDPLKGEQHISGLIPLPLGVLITVESYTHYFIPLAERHSVPMAYNSHGLVARSMRPTANSQGEVILEKHPRSYSSLSPFLQIWLARRALDLRDEDYRLSNNSWKTHLQVLWAPTSNLSTTTLLHACGIRWGLCKPYKLPRKHTGSATAVITHLDHMASK